MTVFAEESTSKKMEEIRKRERERERELKESV